MSVYAGPNVIQNGLVLHLDAGNSRSYSGTGTDWNDISGNINTNTLINTPTFTSDGPRSYFTFNGSSQYTSSSKSISLTNATILAWIWRDKGQDQYDPIIISRNTSVCGLGFATAANLGYSWNDASNTWSWDSGLSTPSRNWCMAAIVIEPTKATAYLGQSTGITSSVNNVSHSQAFLGTVEVARDNYSTNRFFKGRVSIAQIYNIALSATEIAKNFQAIRSRYGV